MKTLDNDLVEGKEVLVNSDFALTENAKILRNEALKQYFSFSTKRITMMAMILVLNIFLSWISVLIFQPFLIGGFLRLEISFLSYLICWRMINGFYAIILVFPATWMRFIGIDPTAEPIGIMAMNLSDLFCMSITVLFGWIFRTKVNMEFKGSMYIKMIIVALIAIFLTSCWNTLLNYVFILELYGAGALKNTWFMATLFGFNVLKFTMNFGFYLIIHNTIELIAKHHR
ncbi:hypothetical protein SCHIN_v1c04120 [Spiroplasma chinense]|uniref:ECF transporter S component n=1 Tax=Spiroplasma chinense TaxID=216932 RepID=A0A5B9Y4K0_9MOLU|nr:hypothetical protein [Spiroplasma chinense]QEH61609.1 hypothetical protein SCHIN_v1c04120 [Spiroplasma chinense]